MTPQENKGAAATPKKARSGEIIDPRLTKALSYPLRVQILAVANQRPISPSEYAKESGWPLSTVAYHFRELKKYDCIEIVDEIPVRGARKTLYRGTRRGLVSAADWRQLGAAVQAGFRGATLQDLVGQVTRALDAGTFDARDDSHFSWTAIMLDDRGWSSFVSILKRTLDEVIDIEVESVKRLAETGEQGFPATFALAGFESPREG